MSDNHHVWWDNTPGKHIGYRPQDSSEPFRAGAEARQPILDLNDPAVIYQGGGFVKAGPF
jgi:uronate dehydrogenase